MLAGFVKKNRGSAIDPIATEREHENSVALKHQTPDACQRHFCIVVADAEGSRFEVSIMKILPDPFDQLPLLQVVGPGMAQKYRDGHVLSLSGSRRLGRVLKRFREHTGSLTLAAQ